MCVLRHFCWSRAHMCRVPCEPFIRNKFGKLIPVDEPVSILLSVCRDEMAGFAPQRLEFNFRTKYHTRVRYVTSFDIIITILFFLEKLSSLALDLLTVLF